MKVADLPKLVGSSSQQYETSLLLCITYTELDLSCMLLPNELLSVKGWYGSSYHDRV